ncbi:phospholipase [Acuticoccus sediminis]|uniref:Phospholipase n=1 Tax=Acuticoccus sediminis TaxID=2184697 RepID=A0A8B2NX12_9HYPH|nr:alpha/beta hydrolase [Acuticoccus sediminis]RAI02343.1 phospholipase [Acuticoccus sediminis]
MNQTLQRLALAAVLTAAFAACASAQTLPSFKDSEYAYPDLITSEFDGDYRVFAYDPLRDIRNEGDASSRAVRPQSASLGIRRKQRDLILKTNAGRVAHIAVGQREDASIIVLFAHGRGANREHGVHDFNSGGNFNRIKNMVEKAGGLYLSPDFADFGQKGAGQVAGLIELYAEKSPRAPVFVACGSMGGAICYNLAENATVAQRLGGILFLGSYPDDAFFSSAAFQRRVPVLLAQGTDDDVYPVEWMEAFFNDLRTRAPGYPVRMICFDRGTHGSPLRMVDWRETINWMLAAR